MRIGVDIGGTKIQGVLLDDEDNIVTKVRTATPSNFSDLLSVVEHLVADLEDGVEAPCSVGIGCPGSVSLSTGLMKNANCTWLVGHPLKADISAILRRSVRIDNDANCFTLAELDGGAGVDADVMLGVVLGSGVGSGIAVHGRVLRGASAIAGEWGHCPLPWSTEEERFDRPCYCGKNACIETFLSGRGFASDHARRAGEKLEAPEIVERAARGDLNCQKSLNLFYDRLARSLSLMINVLDPEIVVLGGGMAKISGICEEVSKRLAQWVFSDEIVVQLVPARHGDLSGALGAAKLWRES